MAWRLSEPADLVRPVMYEVYITPPTLRGRSQAASTE